MFTNEASMQSLSRLTSLGLISITGQDATKFLQGQLSCDVNQLTSNHSSLGCYCDPKGRVLCTFLLLTHGDGYLMCLANDILAETLKELQKYALFSKVTISDVSQCWHLLLSLDLSTLEKLPPEFDFDILPSEALAVSVTKTALLVKIPYSATFLILTTNNNVAANPVLGNEDWQLQLIKSGIAQISKANSGKFTPHQLNYPSLNAVSFNKGCYRGQEIIARMHFLGKLKQHLYYAMVVSQQIPEMTSGIRDSNGKDVGEIINLAKEHNNYHLLATIYDDAKNNNDCFLNLDKKIKLNFCELPYTIVD